MYQRCYDYGKEALLVKVADLYDNSLYFRPREGERGKWFVAKIGLLASLSEPLIRECAMWNRLSRRYEELINPGR